MKYFASFLFILSFLIPVWGEQLQTKLDFPKLGSEDFIRLVNRCFEDLASLQGGNLPGSPIKIFIRPLFKGSNLIETDLPVFNTLEDIEKTASNTLEKSKVLKLCSSNEKDSLSLNVNYSVEKVESNLMILWNIELAKEFMPFGKDSIGIEAPIWKCFKIQLIKEGDGFTDKWLPLKEVLNFLEKELRSTIVARYKENIKKDDCTKILSQ